MSMMDDKDSRRFKDSLSAYGPIRYRNDMWWRIRRLWLHHLAGPSGTHFTG